MKTNAIAQVASLVLQMRSSSACSNSSNKAIMFERASDTLGYAMKAFIHEIAAALGMMSCDRMAGSAFSLRFEVWGFRRHAVHLHIHVGGLFAVVLSAQARSLSPLLTLRVQFSPVTSFLLPCVSSVLCVFHAMLCTSLPSGACEKNDHRTIHKNI